MVMQMAMVMAMVMVMVMVAVPDGSTLSVTLVQIALTAVRGCASTIATGSMMVIVTTAVPDGSTLSVTFAQIAVPGLRRFSRCRRPQSRGRRRNRRQIRSGR